MTLRKFGRYNLIQKNKVWNWPAIFIGNKEHKISHNPERSGRYHTFIYLQTAKVFDYRLARAFVRENNFDQNGENLSINDTNEVMYSTGERPYSELSFVTYWSSLARLVIHHLSKREKMGANNNQLLERRL